MASLMAQTVKNLPANAGDVRDVDLIPGRDDPMEKGMAPIFSHGESHGQRSLEGYSSWGLTESDTTEHQVHREFTGGRLDTVLAGKG